MLAQHGVQLIHSKARFKRRSVCLTYVIFFHTFFSFQNKLFWSRLLHGIKPNN